MSDFYRIIFFFVKSPSERLPRFLTTKLRGSSRYFVVVVSGTQFVSTFHTLVRVVRDYV